MATESINDWVVKVGMDTSQVEKGAKRVEKIMARLAKQQAKLGIGGGSIPGVPSGPRAPRGPSKPKGFQLADDRQLKIANTIDSVMRRAARGLDKNSEEFRKLGLEAEKLKKKISGISDRTGLERLNNQIRVLRDNTTSATATSRRMSMQMDQQRFAANALRNSIRNLGGAYASVFVAIEAGKAFFNTGKAFDSINASLLAASGSYEQAGKDFEFIKDISLGLGIGLKDVAEGFAKIGAAGRASGLSTGVIQESFADISKTVRAFGLSQERAGLVFLGFQQILSKGVVSMQELRQQIGEQLPTAIPIAKKALKEMGSSFTNLDDAVKSGTLSAKEFVPVFARLLRENVESSGALEASLNTITAAQQRFTSTLNLLTIRAFQAGGKKGFISFFDNMTRAAENLTPLFRVIGKVVGATMAVLGGALRAVSILITPIHILADAFTDLFTTMGDTPDETFGFFDAIIASVKALIGILLIPLALLEQIIMTFEKIRNAKDDLFDFGSLGGIFDAPAKFANIAGSGLLSAIDQGLGTNLAGSGEAGSLSNTNSGNTITVNVEGGATDGVVDQISDFFQDMFSTATPSN